MSKTSTNACPDGKYWMLWSAYMEDHWLMHINNIIYPIDSNARYRIDNSGVNQLKVSICDDIMSNPSIQAKLEIEQWSELKIYSFIHHCIRGFLRYDMYNAVTELLKRAEGSFGLVMHCTLEPGILALPLLCLSS